MTIQAGDDAKGRFLSSRIRALQLNLRDGMGLLPGRVLLAENEKDHAKDRALSGVLQFRRDFPLSGSP